MKRLAILILGLAASLTGRASGQDILPPEQAFLVEARAVPGAVIFDWQVADDHYLYKKRFGFSTASTGTTLGEPEFPPGEQHEDEFFGPSVIYRGAFSVRVPVTGPAGPVSIDISGQGCNEAIGLCFPPQKWTRNVVLAAAPAASITSAAGGDQDFLPPDEAFRLAAARQPDGSSRVAWDIAEGYYLYRHRLSVAVDGVPVDTAELGLPPGQEKEDEFFGRVQAYYTNLALEVPGPATGDVTLTIGYQGCADRGLCYPPERRTVTLAPGATFAASADAGPGAGGAPAGGSDRFLLSGALGAGGGEPVAAAPAPAGSASGGDGTPVSAGAPVPEEERLAGVIASGSLVSVAALFFGLGLLLAFTPCVLPMVPILSGLIIGQGDKATPGRSFSLSLAYVLAMALTYTVAGIVVALLGHNLQAAFQHPAVIISFTAVFVALALAMFGAWEFQMPAAIQTRLTEMSNRQAGGSLAGAGVMGSLSALIVGPCVAAPLAASLIVIGQTGDPLRGGLALFSLSMGMGTPLLAFGASAGKLLPRAGAWMDTIKAFFGLLLLGVAIWMLERILPPSVTLALWAALLFIGGVLLGALTPLSRDDGLGRQFAKGAGLLSMVYGVVLLVGAAAGGADPLRPLAGLGPSGNAAGAPAVEFTYVKGNAGLDDWLARAAADNRPVMLDFYADWCVDCKRMDRYTFTDPAVAAALSTAIVLKTDVTPNDAEDRALMARFGIYGPPATLFFSPTGSELKAFRKLGYTPPGPFAAHVRAAFEEARLVARGP